MTTLVARSFRKLATSNADKVSVLQFNVLADSLSQSSMHGKLAFPHTDQSVLPWDRRGPMVLAAICEHHHDIIALEECDKFNYFETALKPKGYAGVFHKKGGGSYDGCALFYDTSSFTLKSKLDVKYTDLGDKGASQVAIIATLVPTKSNHKGLCVALTHLKAKMGPGLCEKRSRQGNILLKQIHKYNTEQLPVIVLGDFNATPDSLVHTLVTKGSVTIGDKTHTQPIGPLTSCYGATERSEFSTFKKRAVELCHTIDYIFYNPKELGLCEVLEIPKKESLPERLPAAYYPSDHLAIAAIFSMDPNVTSV